jgi:hypothetical protein
MIYQQLTESEQVPMGRYILNKAKAARRLLHSVQTHNDSLDFTAFGEKLIHLLFGCVE